MIRVVYAVLLLVAASPATPAPSSADEARLSQAVGAITAADFRGQRARLREIASGLDRVKDDKLAAYREYWRGFAFWRSAINGANETPAPSDVRSDLEAAIKAFRAAERIAPDWIEPKIGLLFSWTGLAYVPGGAKQVVSAEEFVAVRNLLRDKAQGNPRALWFFGGALLFAPKDKGGDPIRATETYRRALAAARAEALGRAGMPAWIPAWGAAENLMSLAYLHAHAEPADRALARAYADGALAIAPDWNYVRDILSPQIEALPDGGVVRATGSDSVSIALEPYVGRLLSLTATIGQEKLKLLLDTGGGQTMIGPGVAAKLGCTPRGRGVALRMSGERVELKYCDSVALEIGGHRFHRSEIAVWDVMTVLPTDFPPVDGVLGLDTFADQPFTLDLGGRTLTLESSETLQLRVARMRRLEARIASGLSGADLTVFVRGDLDEGGWFLVDSGNLDVIQAAPHMLHDGGVNSRETSLRLSGLPPVAVSVRAREIVHDGVLSEGFLRGWIWTFRLATGDVWAARVESDPRP